MPDDNNRYNSGQNNSPPNKSINVTQPRQNTYSNIDATRVSAHTLKEQQALEKLRRQVGGLDQHANRASMIKTIVAIILVVILIAVVIVSVILLTKNKRDSTATSTAIRVSMEIENKSILQVVSDKGYLELRPIWPGDKLPIRAYARNSDDYHGDIDSEEVTPPNVYVRFKIRFILDYKDRFEIIKPTMTRNWTKFDKNKEDSINNGVKEDDHFYYYCGSIPYQKRVELFSELEFDGNNIFIEDAGKYGQIQVIIESIEADPKNLLNNIWPTAPKRWILDITSGRYDSDY